MFPKRQITYKKTQHTPKKTLKSRNVQVEPMLVIQNNSNSYIWWPKHQKQPTAFALQANLHKAFIYKLTCTPSADNQPALTFAASRPASFITVVSNVSGKLQWVPISTRPLFQNCLQPQQQSLRLSWSGDSYFLTLLKSKIRRKRNQGGEKYQSNLPDKWCFQNDFWSCT